MPDVSVVVPTFNRAGLLRETLASILDQTCPAREIIVVDDGSTDDTQALLAGYRSPVRSILIPSGGDLVARNVGLRSATAPLVAFCDSDDLWEPGFLAVMSKKWQSDAQLVACYSNFRTLQGNTLSKRTKFDDAPRGFWDELSSDNCDFACSGKSMFVRLLSFQPFFPSCMMVSRKAFQALGGWDEGVSRVVGSDLATALRIANAPPFGVVKQPLVAIRKHANNFSGNTEAMNLGDACVLEYVVRTRPELKCFLSEVEASCDQRRKAAADSAFSRKDFAAVLEIGGLIKGNKGWKVLLKLLIARLPDPLASAMASIVSS